MKQIGVCLFMCNRTSFMIHDNYLRGESFCKYLLFGLGRILDLGFEKDLTVILNALNTAGPARQNVLLSATLTEGKPGLEPLITKDSSRL